jgi:hypothetical protein
MMADVLSDRALNRATLARQYLLERVDLPALTIVERLVGMQAQEPLNPYTALWSRRERFQPEELSQLLLDRQVVRIVVMRGTIHLVTVDDAIALRPLFQPVLDAELARHRDYAPHLRDLDLTAVLAFARELLADNPLPGPKLRAALAVEFPDLDAPSLAYACRNHLALVQVPPRGVWSRSGAVTTTTLESWVGRAVTKRPSIDEVVLRYFGAFGPATVADFAAWSRLTGLREVVDRMRGQLVVLRDEKGRELFDLPDAPRPEPDTPAPVRFFPEYDNALLSHADRSRFVDLDPGGLYAGDRGEGAVLVDGTLWGSWTARPDRDADRVVLTVRHHRKVTKKAVSAVTSEARRLAKFLHRDIADRDIRFAAVE